MKLPYLCLAIALSCTLCSAQTKTEKQLEAIATAVADEADALYHNEVCSWQGTDLFISRFKGQQSSIHGYFSYPTAAGYACVFLTTRPEPVVIGTVSFNNKLEASSALVNLDERPLTPIEVKYFTMRKKAYELMTTDTMFRSYKSTNANLIPFIYQGRYKVYVLTATNQAGIMLLGNDYLIDFDPALNISSHKRLHESLIQITKPKSGDTSTKGSIHTHLPHHSPYFTVTDLVTLRLYKDYIDMTSHVVVSKDYISIWTGGSSFIIKESPKD